ncbi:MAG: hypothetical protein H7A47_03930 [Verrucomicrobiales bacterium]|nr:hypothetical protein [Verrucomicrobiales bacterium]
MIRTFSFLTCAFPHGAYQSPGFNRPELRAPSIKGQLRWWYDALFADEKEEQRLFGFVSTRQNSRLGLRGNEASRILLRLRPLTAQTSTAPTEFMPHKGREGGTKQAIPAGARYEIAIHPRRGPLTTEQHRRLERVLDAWLLLGAVGQRSNRGAGSVWPDDAPVEEAALMERAKGLLAGSKLRCALLDRVYTTESELRSEAGDFLHAPTTRVQRGSRDIEIAEPWWPFGAAADRKPSPLKLRAVQLGGQLRLVAIWDGRHHSGVHLRNGVEVLAVRKGIGGMLRARIEELVS